MELAACVNKPFDFEITAVEESADERVVVIELWIGRDDEAWSGRRTWPLREDGRERHQRRGQEHQQSAMNAMHNSLGAIWCHSWLIRAACTRRRFDERYRACNWHPIFGGDSRFGSRNDEHREVHGRSTSANAGRPSRS